MNNMKQAVCVLIKIGQGYLAVTRPNSNKQWGLVGGKVDPGETTLQAIIRETKEEVGLILDSSLLVESFTQVCPSEVDYLTTTFVYPDMNVGELNNIKTEAGLFFSLITEESLCDIRLSPFADYNRQLFESLK
jgi:8-oxo-dGTP pyrophosphatase MutT (NUDIX family)